LPSSFSGEIVLRELEKGDLKYLSLFLRFWLPVLGYITLIFALSSVSDLPGPKLFPHMDKAAHLAEYGILGLLVGRAFRSASPPFVTRFWFGLAIIATISVGMLDEAFQSTVPGRESSRMDFTADMIGAVAGLVALLQGSRLWEKGLKRLAGRGES
jgi:VanZ family protein